ncbi:DUF4839 domain-containing protein [Microbacterium memoriense]|uniref:DUF4839 domain-containing protein n=1 Tax=Microbacterium memoriense TaxID=2978350 RepID=A0ABT2P8Q6_9MICO|nr:DUF4839 domain-containing protein [Microbacterium memoriense]MCT9001036.1 DUF4839 domain-containing protein [Microbacterium memoriense]
MGAEDGDVKYQTQTVKAVRGMETRTAAKWRAQGWELVSTNTGKISSELTIRRPKPKTPWILYGALVAIVVVLIAVLIIMNALRGDDSTAEPAETPSSTATATATIDATPSETPPSEPTPTNSAAPAFITSENNPEFAALLALTDYCSPDIAAFASAHAGGTVEFNGHIGAMNSHDGASTRYDFLIGAGDFSEISAPGPSFQYRDVNATSDLHWTGAQPDSVGVGSNLHFVATIDHYEESSCLFLLDPVQTSWR